MASTYNGSVANLVDPLANSPLNSPSHAGQHTEINDALQTLGTWTSFTPTWTNLTVGSASQSFRYTIFNNLMMVQGQIILNGSTMGSSPTFVIPASKTALGTSFGIARYFDTGTEIYVGFCTARDTSIVFATFNAAGTTVVSRDVSATLPMTWANNDLIDMSIVFPIA